MELIETKLMTLWHRAKGKYKLPRCDFKFAQVNYVVGPKCNDASTVVLNQRATPLILIRVKQEKFNTPEIIMDEIIPHELAHAVCMLRPELGHSYRHDAGWCDVYQFLKNC